MIRRWRGDPRSIFIISGTTPTLFGGRTTGADEEDDGDDDDEEKRARRSAPPHPSAAPDPAPMATRPGESATLAQATTICGGRRRG